MKAVQIVNPSEMKVVELEKPTVGVGEVLVRIKYVGFCGSDLNTFLGRNPMVKLPVIPGHEVGAVIEEVGPNVPAGFEKGMNVTLNPYTNCGKCASCRNGRVNACEHNETLGVQRNGVMCEYAVLPWTKIIPAGNISPRDCALIEPMSVGFHAVSRAQVIDNEYVMVIGCGMIGIGAIVRAALRGATVIAVDLDDEKLELAKRVGASYVINSKTENVHERMQQVTEGFGADVVIEAVGSPVTYVMAVEQALSAAEELERSGISTRVVKLNRIAPLDTAAILRETEGAETVLILEDCFENGSVGQQLAAAMEEAGQCCPHMILQNLKDHFAPEGTVDQLRHRFGLDADGVVKTVKEAMSCEQ